MQLITKLISTGRSIREGIGNDEAVLGRQGWGGEGAACGEPAAGGGDVGRGLGKRLEKTQQKEQKISFNLT